MSDNIASPDSTDPKPINPASSMDNLNDNRYNFLSRLLHKLITIESHRVKSAGYSVLKIIAVSAIAIISGVVSATWWLSSHMSKLEERIDGVDKRIESLVQVQSNTIEKNLQGSQSDKIKKIQDEIDVYNQALYLKDGMYEAFCQMRYDDVIGEYKRFYGPLERSGTLHGSLDVGIHLQLLSAYTHRGIYSGIRPEDIDKIASVLDKEFPKTPCTNINYANLSFCYLAIGDFTKARRYIQIYYDKQLTAAKDGLNSQSSKPANSDFAHCLSMLIDFFDKSNITPEMRVEAAWKSLDKSFRLLPGTTYGVHVALVTQKVYADLIKHMSFDLGVNHEMAHKLLTDILIKYEIEIVWKEDKTVNGNVTTIIRKAVSSKTVIRPVGTSMPERAPEPTDPQPECCGN